MSQEALTREIPVTDTEAIPAPKPRLPRPAPRKKRRGDRKDGRLVRTAPVMAKMTAFIMKDRCDALNYFSEELDVTETDAFCKRMISDGYEGFSFLHIMLAAYVRTVSQKPALNRFISGQRIYTRNNIEVNMVIKKDMSEESPDTAISVVFEPDDTVLDVYDKFTAAVRKEKDKEELDSSFDKTAGALASLPRFLLRAAVRLLFWLDYHGWLPKFLTDLSPFHGSMIITSMGSLGIKPIYHHLYNFGNLPVFISYGVKRTVYKIKRDGSTEQRRMMDLKVVTDERICDGFYYASAFKMIRRLVEHPASLLDRPEQIVEDID